MDKLGEFHRDDEALRLKCLEVAAQIFQGVARYSIDSTPVMIVAADFFKYIREGKISYPPSPEGEEK